VPDTRPFLQSYRQKVRKNPRWWGGRARSVGDPVRLDVPKPFSQLVVDPRSGRHQEALARRTAPTVVAGRSGLGGDEPAGRVVPDVQARLVVGVDLAAGDGTQVERGRAEATDVPDRGQEGRQDVGSDPGSRRFGISVTDPCLGWDDTAALLRGAAARVRLAGEGRQADDPSIELA